MKDITLGQYYPADSIIHRLDPRVKLLVVICYTLFLFINDTFISYLLNIAVLTGIVILTRVPFRQIVKGIKSILFLLLLLSLPYYLRRERIFFLNMELSSYPYRDFFWH